MVFDKVVLSEIRDRLLRTQKTVATAESVTAGNVQAALSQAKDASRFFQGGITTYNLGQKYRHLKVEPIHAESCLCVSERVATEMAINVCNLFHSDYGISVTGFASKMPEKGIEKLYAFIAIAGEGKIIYSEKIDADTGEKDSQLVQIFYTTHALKMINNALKQMNMENEKSKEKDTRETSEELKNQSADKNELHKGYNEKNPVQPEGAFEPDSKTEDSKPKQ